LRNDTVRRRVGLVWTTVVRMGTAPSLRNFEEVSVLACSDPEGGLGYPTTDRVTRQVMQPKCADRSRTRSALWLWQRC
jgi:hypothetical protein